MRITITDNGWKSAVVNKLRSDMGIDHVWFDIDGNAYFNIDTHADFNCPIEMDIVGIETNGEHRDYLVRLNNENINNYLEA